MAHVLIIDDNIAVRKMLRETLEHYGHTVREAENGKQGLALFHGAKPDLIITDIVMPEKEGTAVLIELRQMRTPVKIIAISGGGMRSASDYLHIAKLLGAKKVLTKPFSVEVLMTAVNAVLAE